MVDVKTHLQHVLADSVTRLCRDVLRQQDCNVAIDGLIGVTINDGSVFLVKIDERIDWEASSDVSKPRRSDGTMQTSFSSFSVKEEGEESLVGGASESCPVHKRQKIEWAPPCESSNGHIDEVRSPSQKKTKSLHSLLKHEPTSTNQCALSNAFIKKESDVSLSAETGPQSRDSIVVEPYKISGNQTDSSMENLNGKDGNNDGYHEPQNLSSQASDVPSRRRKSQPRKMHVTKYGSGVLKVPSFPAPSPAMNSSGLVSLLSAPTHHSTPANQPMDLELLLSTAQDEPRSPKEGHIANSNGASNSPRRLECHLCGKTFTTIKGKRRHMDIHSGKSFVCNLCQARCSRKDAMMRHMKRKHGLGLSPSDLLKMEVPARNGGRSSLPDMADRLEASDFSLPNGLINSIDSESATTAQTSTMFLDSPDSMDGGGDGSLEEASSQHIFSENDHCSSEKSKHQDALSSLPVFPGAEVDESCSSNHSDDSAKPTSDAEDDDLEPRQESRRKLVIDLTSIPSGHQSHPE